MKFIEYLKDKNVLEGKGMISLRDTSAMAKRTAYQEVYAALSSERYGLNYDELEKHFLTYASELGLLVEPLHATAGCVCDAQIYEALGGISEALLSYLMPLRSGKTGKRMAITTRPDDELLREKLARCYGKSEWVLGICPPNIWEAIYSLYGEPLLLGKMATTFSEGESSGSDISDKSRESDSRKFYTMLMNVGIDRHASDIHFIPCSDKCQVLFRIDGHNHHYTDIPKDVLERIVNILKADGRIAASNPHDPVDGKVRYSPSQGAHPGDEVDLRVSVIPTKQGSDLNVRYLSDKLYTFEELGMSEANIAAFKDLLSMPSGLVVQVGPTGSGKSTTLYAGLSYVHSTLRNIITVEDPVEILMDGISQVDVNADGKNGLGFAAALKACLRHDPDVIVVGELRDNATAFEAIRAANTGHLVLTSLHTNDSVGVFERLINLGIDSYSLGEVIAAVMGQRLVRRLCPFCKEKYELSLKSKEARFYGLPNQEGTMEFYHPVGCVHCSNTGYHGRIAINEVLAIDRELRNLVQRHGVRMVIEEHLKKTGFRTMYQDGIDKAKDGITSLEELENLARDSIAFKG